MPANPQVTEQMVEKALAAYNDALRKIAEDDVRPMSLDDIRVIGLQAALTAALADHVVVPREPSTAMLRAGCGPLGWSSAFTNTAKEDVRSCYRAMIAAASPLVSQEG